ncbi:MAG: carboxypeptidase-like regulatory domain-containing protein [Flavipsychrobacter sp.]
MRLRYYIFTVLLLLGVAAKAQTLKGVVTDAAGKPLAAVTVVDVNTQQSTYTDAQGEYTIPAKSGDKIAFSSIGFKSAERLVPPTLGVTELNVQLQQLTYQLNEATVRLHQYTPYQLDSMERRSPYKLPLQREKESSAMHPISLVAERVFGMHKDVYKFQKDFNYWEKQRFIDTRYTPELVESLTSLQGDTLANFMNAYPMDYDFSRNATDLEIKMWIRYNYKQYANKHKEMANALTDKKP